MTPELLQQEAPLLAALAALLLAHNLPVLRWLVAPLALLGTWAHELSHGIAALLVGGRIERLRIFADGSGLAETRVPARRLASAWVAGAGYPGAALIGAALLAARHQPWAGAEGLVALGAVVGLSTLLWVRNAAGFVLLGGLAAALIAAGRFLPAPWDGVAWTAVAASVALEALGSLRALFGASHRAGGQAVVSDARRMAQLLWLPALLWSLAWLLWALALTGVAVWRPL